MEACTDLALFPFFCNSDAEMKTRSLPQVKELQSLSLHKILFSLIADLSFGIVL